MPPLRLWMKLFTGKKNKRWKDLVVWGSKTAEELVVWGSEMAEKLVVWTSDAIGERSRNFENSTKYGNHRKSLDVG